MRRRVITVREYETLRVSDTLVTAGEKALTHREADGLLRFDESLSVRAFEHRFQAVRFLNYCGVIQLGSLTIEILPKIAEATGNNDELRLDRILLLRMLSVAYDLPLAEVSQAGVERQDEHLLDVVIAFFCRETARQLHRGVIKRYETSEDNLPFIRGKWMVGTDVRRNYGRQDLVNCEFDEFSDDNPYNQAIKATLRVLMRHTVANSHLSQTIALLSSAFENVTERHFTAQAVRQLPRNRLVNRYETVFRLCEWFLAGESPNVHAGAEKTLGLLFDMNALFEKFVAHILQSALPAGMVLKKQGPRAYLVRDMNSGVGCFQMKPDLCITKESGQVLAIIDTKWKLIDPSSKSKKFGVQQADMYQLHTYGHSYRAERLALWYPVSANVEAGNLTTYEFLKSGEERIGTRLTVNALDLQANLASDNLWKNQMTAQMQALVSALVTAAPDGK